MHSSLDPVGSAPLTSALRQIAALPLADGQSLPSTSYGNPDMAALERSRIFQQEWICIGREDQLPKPGDYLTDSIDGQAVIAIRQKEGTIKVFSNSCLHRLTRLATGAGHVPGLLVCPYHAWSYNLGGGLMATPYSQIQNTPECKAGALRLREFAVELWAGFVFVSLAEAPTPLTPRVAGLEARLPGVNMAAFGATRMHDESWPCDWKMLVDNFVEGYHIFTVHRTTLEPLTPTRLGEMQDGEDGYSLQFYRMVETAAAEFAHPGKPGVPADARDKVFTFQVFPSFVVSGSHNWLWWMSIQPAGVGLAKLRWGICLTPEVIADPAMTDYGPFLDAFIAKANDEDHAAVVQAHDGVAGPLALTGRLVPMDQPIWEFIRYLDRQINGAPTPPTGT
jgi:choline monooxygenase